VPKVLYGVSPIGFGHATRSVVIIRRLRQAGVDVRIFSGGKGAEFFRMEGLDVDDIVPDAVPYVDGGVMKRVVLWYLRSWFSLQRAEARTERIFESFKPDLVVCDEEFSGLLVAEKRGVKRVFITDELELGFARTWIARKVEERVYSWYKRLQNAVDLLIVPDFGESSGNRRHVEPIVREVTGSREEALSSYGLPADGKMILFSMSGSGIGDFLLKKALNSFRQAAPPGTSVVVTGNRGPAVSAPSVFDLGVVPDNQNLVAAADLVVSTAGKSLIDEAAATGTPAIVIPIKQHAEQERNAASLGYSFEDMWKLAELIRQKIGKKEAPRSFRGAENASRLILSMLGNSQW